MRNKLLLLTLGVLMMNTSYAQMGKRMGRHAMQSNYNVKTVTTINGKITKIEEISSTKGMNSGVHLMVKTAKGTMAVHLGPKSYIDDQNFQMNEGDEVEVTGSKVKMGGKEVIIAREVKANDATLSLRDENGVPMWAGQRPMQMPKEQPKEEESNDD